MRLTKQSTYAVRALMYCAANHPNLSQINAISKAYGISEAFLFKLIKPLVKNGILETVRGRKGGIRLSRDADQITLLDSISLTEDSFALAECFEPGGTQCPLVDRCDFSSALHSALAAFNEVLARHTIADLVARRIEMRSLLHIAE